MAAFLWGHRKDDRLDPIELALVELDAAELLAHAGQHPEQVLQWSHLPDLAHLVQEVVEIKLRFAELALEITCLLLVICVAGALNQRQNISHAENPLSHAVRVESLELVELLPS